MNIFQQEILGLRWANVYCVLGYSEARHGHSYSCTFVVKKVGRAVIDGKQGGRLSFDQISYTTAE